jgi:FKBP-type peptidyl-prolyl cis-trans isomerase (trigger factor)
MGIIEDILAGAAGYTISEASKSHPLRDAIDERFNRSKQKVSLEKLIDEYARRYEIYTSKNEFAHQLHQIAERYEEYDYEDVYGRR